MRTRRRFTTKSRDPQTLVSWILTRGAQALTCAVERGEDGRQCSVALLPHWDAMQLIVERFTQPATALARHAGLVADLRTAGWRVAAYTA